MKGHGKKTKGREMKGNETKMKSNENNLQEMKANEKKVQGKEVKANDKTQARGQRRYSESVRKPGKAQKCWREASSESRVEVPKRVVGWSLHRLIVVSLAQSMADKAVACSDRSSQGLANSDVLWSGQLSGSLDIVPASCHAIF